MEKLSTGYPQVIHSLWKSYPQVIHSLGKTLWKTRQAQLSHGRLASARLASATSLL